MGTIQKETELKRQSLQVFFTIVAVFAVYGIINLCIPQWRPAPDEVVSGIKPLIPHPIGNSFPSGHALFSVALFIGIWEYVRPCQKTLLFSTIII
jgi:membrane-associated phospholipid phosphatase